MKYFIVSLFSICLFSCAGDPESTEEVNEDNSGVPDNIMELEDSLLVQEDGEIFTAEAAIDGPDDELWVFRPGEWEGEPLEPMPETYEVLHVIPYSGVSRTPYTEMSYTNKMNFTLWDKFAEHTGKVIFFYDREKTMVASEFHVIDGKPEGMASIYKPDGAMYMQKRYENGLWVESIVYPYSCDWTFDQAESKLYINDPGYIRNSSGETVHRISATLREKEPGDNHMYKIMEKASFENLFKINNEIFTGVLEAYFEPSGIDGDNIYYQLNFKDGMLNGDVKIYNDWAELELHEIFNMGELDTTVYVLDYSEMDGLAKPIIYLYPEKEMLVDVQLDLKGELTHTYPKYNKGWQVKASPDGTLLDKEGKEYYALYWEGNNHEQFQVSEGFVVPGEKTAAFLETSLEILGLNRREANEFIVFWLPILEQNPYNLIHFSSDEYTEMAQLKITPQPETLIRVMMVYKPLQSPIEIPQQDLAKLAKKRKGFTVVEWGGSLLKSKVAL